LSGTVQVTADQPVLPSPRVIRERIEAIPQEDIRFANMTEYMFAGRISEVIGKSSPKDNTVARGPRGTDVRMDVYANGEEAVVFTVKTAKRAGKIRNVALPVKYEEWAMKIKEYFDAMGGGLVFPFTRQYVGTHTRDLGVYKGLTYQIERYNVWNDGAIEKVVATHSRPFTLHALRHVRPTELVEVYNFDGVDLAAYGGWTMKTAVGVGSLDRYLSLGWQRYFPKLLRRRVE
jgi:hypothetical protein